MGVERWSEEEIKILTSNFDSTRGELQEMLEDAGYTRTIQAIKTKKRDLRASGEMPAYGVSSVASDRTAGSCAGEIGGDTSDSVGDAGMDSEGFFPDASKREIYSEYKSMMQTLVEEAKAGATVGKVSATGDGKTSDCVGSKTSDGVGDDAESIVLLLSDLHIGKLTVGPDGETTYDTEIAISRVRQLTQSVKRVISFAQKSTTIDEIVIAICGDALDGDQIYRTHAYNLDDHVAGQLKAATKSLWELVVELANIEGIKKVRVATVRGNHGRLGMDAHVDSNADNLLYDNLQFAATLHGDPRITVTTKYSSYHVIEVRGHRMLLTHEAPLTCDTPSARAKLMGWIDLYDVDCILSGHWHHEQIATIADRYIFRNGSLPGSGDDLSHRMGVKSSPCQLLFGVSKHRLPTFIYPVTLD